MAEHAVLERQLPVRRQRGDAGRVLAQQREPELDVPEQPAGLRQPDLGAVRELPRAAEVVDERGGRQQIAVQPRVQRAGLLRERAARDAVLEQPAEVGMVPVAGARRAAPLRTQLAVVEQDVDQRPQPGVVDLAREVLEEAVELVEVAVGDR